MPDTDFTYAEIGATRDPDALPGGYRHVHLRERIGSGRLAFTKVAEATMTWAIHQGAGFLVRAGAERVAVGVDVTNRAGLGPIRLAIPCRVVWTVEETTRVGFAYGTLPGHPARGEEAFVVEIDDEDDVWFTVTAFSRPTTWYARLGGPVARAVQAAATRRCVIAARRLAG